MTCGGSEEELERMKRKRAASRLARLRSARARIA